MRPNSMRRTNGPANNDRPLKRKLFDHDPSLILATGVLLAGPLAGASGLWDSPAGASGLYSLAGASGLGSLAGASGLGAGVSCRRIRLRPQAGGQDGNGPARGLGQQAGRT